MYVVRLEREAGSGSREQYVLWKDTHEVTTIFLIHNYFMVMSVFMFAILSFFYL